MYYVVPLQIPVGHKICLYYREFNVGGGKEPEWDYVGGNPAVLYPYKGRAVIQLAPSSFVKQKFPDMSLWDSTARLVAAFVKPLDKSTGSQQIYCSAVSTTIPDTDWAVSVDDITWNRLGVIAIFGIVGEDVDEDGNPLVTKIVCSVDPEIQN